MQKWLHKAKLSGYVYKSPAYTYKSVYKTWLNRISSVNANEFKLAYDITKGASIGIPKSDEEDGQKA